MFRFLYKDSKKEGTLVVGETIPFTEGKVLSFVPFDIDQYNTYSVTLSILPISYVKDESNDALTWYSVYENAIDRMIVKKESNFISGLIFTKYESLWVSKWWEWDVSIFVYLNANYLQ